MVILMKSVDSILNDMLEGIDEVVSILNKTSKRVD